MTTGWVILCQGSLKESVGVMVQTRPVRPAVTGLKVQRGSLEGMLNMIVFGLLALVGVASEPLIACLSDPGPLSLVLVTAKIVPAAAVGLIDFFEKLHKP